MHLKKLELHGFKSFAKKSEFLFDVPIVAIVGPNGSGKSNVVEAIRFVLGEQSVKSMRGKTGSDLIFKGSRDIAKMSRASVSIVFDNKERVFHIHAADNRKINLDFDEIVITREVFSDGGNKYFINGGEVRMKDVHELIASVNIGSSGHHIISQGEADRYLNANIKDRRVLIEEALGLKVYQYRLKEATRKLTKAQENVRESELLRRELAPHLRFLKRQVDKIEKARELRENLQSRYQRFFYHEERLLRHEQQDLDERRNTLRARLDSLESFFASYTKPEEQRFPKEARIQEQKEFIHKEEQAISNHLRELGKIEGMIRVFKEQEDALSREEEEKTRIVFGYEQVFDFFRSIVKKLHLITKDNIESMVDEVKADLDLFINDKQEKGVREKKENFQAKIAELKEQQAKLEQLTTEANGRLEQHSEVLKGLMAEKQSLHEQSQLAQKQYYEYLAEQKELLGKQALVDTQHEALAARMRRRDEEYTEAKTLLGEEALVDEYSPEENETVSNQEQELERRELERIKIRIEDMGGGSGVELMEEYQETQERDAFLEKEIEDITKSIESLEAVIADLKTTLNREFDLGIEKINTEFHKFFTLMFGGGSASLEPQLIQKRRKAKEGGDAELTDDESDEESSEYGIDIKVQLPRKKVSDLDMLSGGERSLTSIALLFALSQVNPPPFLVLDETDAALDEANSQKYGDMIESLSEYSQLIVVTHNRETMSRAQTLFGVTLGSDDCSTTLSLRLEDATKYAK